MKRKAAILVLMVALVVGMTSGVFAGDSDSDDFNISIEILEAIQISIENMDFGEVYVGSDTVQANTPATVTGGSNQDFLISGFDDEAVLEGPGDNITVVLENDASDMNLGEDGQYQFDITGSIDSAQLDTAAGSYSGEATVTVQYAD